MCNNFSNGHLKKEFSEITGPEKVPLTRKFTKKCRINCLKLIRGLLNVHLDSFQSKLNISNYNFTKAYQGHAYFFKTCDKLIKCRRNLLSRHGKICKLQTQVSKSPRQVIKSPQQDITFPGQVTKSPRQDM
jgi:hypothetical protein